MLPAISVILPAYNAASFLDDALRSIMAQTVPVAEILVVDDGSDDDTAGVAQSWGAPVRLLSQPHRSAAAARNLGVQHASGQMLAFLDADDIWNPHKLQRQLAAPGVIAGQAIAFGQCREFSDPAGRFPFRAELVAAPSLSAMLIARDTFLDVGLFREDLALGELMEWLGRPAAACLPQHMVPDAHFLRRVHAANTTRQAGRAAAYLGILRERRNSTRRAGAI